MSWVKMFKKSHPYSYQEVNGFVQHLKILTKILLLISVISLKCVQCSVSKLTGVNILGGVGWGKVVVFMISLSLLFITQTQQAAYTETKMVSNKEQVLRAQRKSCSLLCPRRPLGLPVMEFPAYNIYESTLTFINCQTTMGQLRPKTGRLEREGNKMLYREMCLLVPQDIKQNCFHHSPFPVISVLTSNLHCLCLVVILVLM